MQGIVILTPPTYDLSSLWNSIQSLKGVSIAEVENESFSIEQGDSFIVVRCETDLSYFDDDEIAEIQSRLASPSFKAYAFEYRMSGFEFVTAALVALLSAVPACFVNDHDLIASGQDILDAIRSSPSWDWRTAPGLPTRSR